ncbi:MAG: hypothetical protein R3C56_36505 [Pirellulaceae bacterium]
MPMILYVIEKSGREERVYDVYSCLLKDRIIFFARKSTTKWPRKPVTANAISAVGRPQSGYPFVHQFTRRQRQQFGHLRYDAICVV